MIGGLSLSSTTPITISDKLKEVMRLADIDLSNEMTPRAREGLYRWIKEGNSRVSRNMTETARIELLKELSDKWTNQLVVEYKNEHAVANHRAGIKYQVIYLIPKPTRRESSRPLFGAQQKFITAKLEDDFSAYVRKKGARKGIIKSLSSICLADAARENTDP
jgi:hypothetical protein